MPIESEEKYGMSLTCSRTSLTLAQQGPAIEGDAPSVRVPLCADMEAAQVAEGATISETEAALSEIEIHTRKLALLTKMSYEAYSHSDATNLLTDTMRRSITNAADKAFLTNAKGSDGTPVGITNTDGAVKPEVGITDSLAPPARSHRGGGRTRGRTLARPPRL